MSSSQNFPCNNLKRSCKMPSGKVNTQSRKISRFFQRENFWTARKNLENQFCPRKLAKVFLHRVQRTKAQNQAPRKCGEKNLRKKSPLEPNLDRFCATLSGQYHQSILNAPRTLSCKCHLTRRFGHCQSNYICMLYLCEERFGCLQCL